MQCFIANMKLQLLKVRAKAVPVLLLGSVAYSLLTACGTPPNRAPLAVITAAPSPSGLPLPTTSASVATAFPSPTLDLDLAYANATKIAAATVAAGNRSRLATQIALSPPVPTRTPGHPPPNATETPVWGLIDCPPGTNAEQPRDINCWRGMVGGQIVWLTAGGGGAYDDPAQGRVTVEGPTDPPYTGTVYNTPGRVGLVHITAVNGLRFTIRPVDPHATGSWVFDLATRQWVAP